MIFVPKGKFIYRVVHRVMEGDCQYDHGPRPVEAGAFYAEKYPVTNRRYAVFLKESGYEPADGTNFLRHWRGDRCPAEYLDYPVTWVSLKDARAYATYYGCRLPKDFEWQYIAGGNDKRLYPWGEHFDPSLCNTGEEITPVDAFPEGAGPFGHFDLCGNTWEMVDDEIDDGEHIFSFLRGGSSYKAPHFWHAEGGSHRNDYHLKMQLLNEGLNRCGTVSFRCLRDA
jgi:formylglycine-generating enzyme required for sulfatase activity